MNWEVYPYEYTLKDSYEFSYIESHESLQNIKDWHGLVIAWKTTESGIRCWQKNNYLQLTRPGSLSSKVMLSTWKTKYFETKIDTYRKKSEKWTYKKKGEPCSQNYFLIPYWNITLILKAISKKSHYVQLQSMDTVHKLWRKGYTF